MYIFFNWGGWNLSIAYRRFPFEHLGAWYCAQGFHGCALAAYLWPLSPASQAGAPQMQLPPAT